LRSGSAERERERERLHTGIEKLDFELSIGDGLRLSDQLIDTLFGTCAGAMFVNVNSMSRAWLLSIDQDAKSDGCCRRRWAHDEIEIAGVNRYATRGEYRGYQHLARFIDERLLDSNPPCHFSPCGRRFRNRSGKR
jgi:hypothetical protein